MRCHHTDRESLAAPPVRTALAQVHTLQALERAVYKGLRVSDAVEACVLEASYQIFGRYFGRHHGPRLAAAAAAAAADPIAADPGAGMGTAAGGAPTSSTPKVMNSPGAAVAAGRLQPQHRYGCIHARIELDMVRSQKANRAGAPPILNDYLSQLDWHEELRTHVPIFVAVGRDISAADEARLRRPTPLGDRLLRTPARGKSAARGTDNATHDADSSYTRDALIDLELCRRASWFVGWPGSTFARLVGAFQYLQARRGFYAVCPHPANLTYIALDESTLMSEHGFCTVPRTTSFIARPELVHGGG